MEHRKRTWIVWENLRRSLDLSNYFKSNLIIIEYQEIARRYRRFVDTITIFQREEADLVFVQNPFIISVATVCI